MRALIIVDVQNDFCPGGALGAPEGDTIIPIINRLKNGFPFVVASKDWHPEDTVHFNTWPLHCIKESHGAEFHPELETDNIDAIVYKGTGNQDDGYSAFEATNVNLAELLQENESKELYITGLATDYCVKNTAIDAAKKGFDTFVVEDAIKAVNVNPGDEERAKEEMKHHGVKFINSSMLLERPM